ncbi:non-specific serine/threonine kinase domain protein [Mycobacterium xenopi 3993]|nr:non-specific serine/threonine kinase domain protein [Mycobacterium xenopi 3993]
MVAAYLFHRIPLPRPASGADSGCPAKSTGQRRAVTSGTAFAGYTILRPLGAGGWPRSIWRSTRGCRVATCSRSSPKR